METTRRSIVKTLTWRVFAIIITAVLVVLVTGSWETAIQIGIIDMTVKTILFFIHERIWARIGYGNK